MQLAIAFEVSDAALANAYIRARELHGAYNPDMEAIVREMDLTGLPSHLA